MPNIRVEFSNEENKEELSDAVLAYLQNDYIERKMPKNHFFYNRETIVASFHRLEKMTLSPGFINNYRNAI